MNLAKVSANGQITVPVEIRRKLMLREGDKVLFIERDNGEIVIDNASSMAVWRAQKAFENVARTANIKNEDEVQALLMTRGTERLESGESTRRYQRPYLWRSSSQNSRSTW